MATSTSFRIGEEARRALAERAAAERSSATSLLERLILEGVAQLDHPGIVFRGPMADRRAGLAGGPDVWEIVARLQELDGPEEERIGTLAHEIDLHPKVLRIAVEYAAEHPDDVRDRIARQHEAAERSRRAAEQRAALLA